MKKILLSITAVLAVGFINAQIYTAGDSTAFAAWTAYDSDGDTHNWSIKDAAVETTLFAPQGHMLLSESFINGTGALTPDNLIVSPVINCSTNPTVFLSWGAGSTETTASTYYAEYYSVYVVSNPAMLLTGTYPPAVWEGTLSAGEMIEWKSIDVSAGAGGQSSVYVVFRHHNCTDMFRLWVDGISLTTGVLGAEENKLEASVYPNPTNAILNIETNAAANSVSIISMDGKVVSTTAMSGLTGSVDVSDLTEGVYFYEVAIADGSVIRNTFLKK